MATIEVTVVIGGVVRLKPFQPQEQPLIQPQPDQLEELEQRRLNRRHALQPRNLVSPY